MGKKIKNDLIFQAICKPPITIQYNNKKKYIYIGRIQQIKIMNLLKW